MTILCPKCGAQQPAEEAAEAAGARPNACKSCGHPLSVEAAGEASSQQPAGIAGLKGVTLLGADEGTTSKTAADRYYIQRKSGKVFGPFENGLIRQMIERRKLSGQEGVSRDKQVWLPILSVPAFAKAFEGRQPGGEGPKEPEVSGRAPSQPRERTGPRRKGPAAPVTKKAPAIPNPLAASTRFNADSQKAARARSATTPSGLPSVYEEPTRALDEFDLEEAKAASAPPLPSLDELPESFDFEVSAIPGLTTEPPAIDLFGDRTEVEDTTVDSIPELPLPKSLPELPVPKSKSTVSDVQVPKRGAPGLALPGPPRPSALDAKTGIIGQPAPESPPAAPELPIPKERSAGPELPIPKERAAAPELPIPKERSAGPELPQRKSQVGLPELPVPKRGAPGLTPPPEFKEVAPEPTKPRVKAGLPELPPPKTKGISGLPTPKSKEIAELPTPKAKGIAGLPRPKSSPELPVPKRRPELPLPKGTIPELPMPKGITELPLPKLEPELPILADGLDLLGPDGLPELPTPKFDEVHLPAPSEDEQEVTTRPFEMADLDLALGMESGDLPLADTSADASDFLLGNEAPTPSLPGLDDDLLPPPVFGFEGSTDMLADLDDDYDSGAFRLPDVSPVTPAAAAVGDAAAVVPGVRVAAEVRPRRARPSAARIAVFVALVVVVGGAALFLSGVIGGDDEGAGGEGLPSAGGPQDSDRVVVTRAETVDFAILRPGNFGDYVAFLQPAISAVDSTQGRDLDALARLVVGQSLMAAQYGPDVTLTEDLAVRAQTLGESNEPLQALARGASAAANGDVVRAFALLEDIGSGEYAAWAHLFMGIAELQRFERARAGSLEERAAGAGLEAGQPTAADEEPVEPGQAATALEGTGDAAVSAAEAGDIPSAASPIALDPRAGEHLVMAARLDPQLVPARYFLGVEARLRDDDPAARQAFVEALEIEPQHVPSLLGLSDLLIDEGDFDEVSRRLALVVDDASQASAQRERSRVHYLMGRVALARRRFEQAAEELQRACTVDPSNTAAMLELSDLFYETEQFQRAIDFLEQHTGPGADAADLSLALAHNRIGLAEASPAGTREEILSSLVSDLEAGRVEHPSDPRFHYFLGQVRQAQRLFDDAEASYRAAIELDDQFRPAYLELAELARLSNEIDAASELLGRAEEVGSPDSRIDTQIGDAYRRLGRPESAAAAYRRAVDIDPFNMGARLELARYHIERRDRPNLERALSELEVVEAAGVDDAELHALFAEAQYRLGYLNQARERMNRVAERQTEESNPEYLYLVGRINFDAGELAEDAQDAAGARQYYELARQNFSAAYLQGRDSAEARYWEARALLELGDLDRAVPTFRRAIDQTLRAGEPRGDFQFWLGYSLEELGQYQQALEAYMLVDRYDLRWALSNPELFYRRGRLLAQSRRFRMAKRDLQWALILNRNDARAAFELAEVHALEQDFDRALRLWLRSLEVNPDQPRAHYRLGTTCLRVERLPEATSHLEAARDMGYGEVEPDLYRTLGYIYKDAGRNGDAIRELRRYLQSGAVPSESDEEIEVMRQIERLGGTR